MDANSPTGNRSPKLNRKDYKVLNNLLFVKNRKSTQIDRIVVSRFGIFVIETKNYYGIITGNENDAEWTLSQSDGSC